MTTVGPPGLRPLAGLTAAVVVAHLLVLQQASMSLSPGDAPALHTPPLNTRMVTPPAPVAEPAPAPKPSPPPPRKPPAAPKARPAPPPESGPAPSPVLGQNLAEPIVELSPTATDSVANSTATGTGTTALAEAPAQPASAPSTSAPVDGATLNAAVPSSVRLLYNLEGQARNLQYTARGEVLWRQDGQRYNLLLTVSAFLIGSRSQTSEGDLTPQGLAPRRYADKWKGEQAAHFNRDTGRIIFSVNTPEAALLPGAQDRLSLFIQIGALMAADPKRMAAGNSFTLQTVSTREAEPWIITADGEESLKLPGGEVIAYKFSRAPRRPFDTRLELWIAPSMNYLPVRIRVTQSNGDFVDQKLRASEPAGKPD